MATPGNEVHQWYIAHAAYFFLEEYLTYMQYDILISLHTAVILHILLNVIQ